MKKVIVKTPEGEMAVEDFLLWELRGGQSTYEADMQPGDTLWEDLTMEEQIAYMAQSIAGDVLDGDGILFTVIDETTATEQGGKL